MIIVFGSDGFIGKSILNYLNFFSNPDQYIGINRHNVELLDKIDYSKYNYSTIIYCVGNKLQYNKSAESSYYIENEIKLIYQTISKIKSQKINVIYFSSAGTLYKQTKNLPSFEYSPTEPHNNYGLYKIRMENHLLQAFIDRDISVFILRVSNVYGPFQKPNLGQGLISTLVNNLLNNKQSNIHFEGKEMRDYLYIDDLCSAVFSIASKSHLAPNYLYNISRGESVSTNFIINKVYEALSSHSFNRERNLISYLKSFEHERQSDSFIDSSKFQLEFSWLPRVNLDFGIDKVLEYQVKK
jgi:UDP-glucose 4-epimerase